MKKGITLVALVVTIVILLILATVTIGLILGDDSMFGRAEEGKVKTELTQLGERLQTAGTSVLVDVQSQILNGATLNATQTETALKGYLMADDQAKVTVTGTNPEFKVEVFDTDVVANRKYKIVYTLNLTTFRSDYVVENV